MQDTYHKLHQYVQFRKSASSELNFMHLEALNWAILANTCPRALWEPDLLLITQAGPSLLPGPSIVEPSSIHCIMHIAVPKAKKAAKLLGIESSKVCCSASVMWLCLLAGMQDFDPLKIGWPRLSHIKCAKLVLRLLGPRLRRLWIKRVFCFYKHSGFDCISESLVVKVLLFTGQKSSPFRFCAQETVVFPWYLCPALPFPQYLSWNCLKKLSSGSNLTFPLGSVPS